MYFKNLFALRFIGAFAVILGHIEFIKSLNGIPNINHFSFYKNTNGHMGVLLFFVLSGFLITYLLIKELEENKRINLKKFYFRRIIRIWPIYFLMITISLILLPIIYNLLNIKHEPLSNEGVIYYFLILPNVSKSLGYYYDGAVHLWSIGVEEQFYLIWPVFLCLFRKAKLFILVSIFIGVSMLPSFLWFFKSHHILFDHNESAFKTIESFLMQLKINSMALGGIIAVGVYYKKKWMRIFEYNFVGIIVIILTTFSWFTGQTFGEFKDEVYSFFFALTIGYLINEKCTLINLENILFSFLGKISYGLYVYHWLIILTVIYILNLFKIKDLVIYNTLLYSLALFFTVLISHLSFKYIETPFLNLKNKFSI